jgi:hypothetical protein
MSGHNAAAIPSRNASSPSFGAAASHTREPALRIALGVGCSADAIDLVEHFDLRNCTRADRAQHFIDLTNMLETLGIAGIDDVQQQAGVARLLQRRAECSDQLVGQVTHEAHGIG